MSPDSRRKTNSNQGSYTLYFTNLNIGMNFERISGLFFVSVVMSRKLFGKDLSGMSSQELNGLVEKLKEGMLFIKDTKV